MSIHCAPVAAVATRILAFDDAGFHTFNGTYTDYRAFLAKAEAGTPDAANAPGGGVPDTAARGADDAQDATAAAPRKSGKELRRARAAERAQRAPRMNDLKRRVAAAEERIAALETEQAAILAELSSGKPDLDFAGLNKRLAAIQTEIATVTNLWEQAASELEFLQA